MLKLWPILALERERKRIAENRFCTEKCMCVCFEFFRPPHKTARFFPSNLHTFLLGLQAVKNFLPLRYTKIWYRMILYLLLWCPVLLTISTIARGEAVGVGAAASPSLSSSNKIFDIVVQQPTLEKRSEKLLLFICLRLCSLVLRWPCSFLFFLWKSHGDVNFSLFFLFLEASFFPLLFTGTFLLPCYDRKSELINVVKRERERISLG